MFVILLILSLLGCDPAVQYARQKYPKCDVEKIEEGTVRIECPGEDPFEKHYRER